MLTNTLKREDNGDPSKSVPEKIGLVTCFLDNYGACLQAFALFTSIKKLGYECEIIRYTEPQGYARRSLQDFVRYNRGINWLRGALNTEYKKNYLMIRKKHYSCRRFRKRFLSFSKTEYRSIRDFSQIANRYDAFVCGSDQIWNPTFYGRCNPVYYLHFALGKKKIAYAPSIGLSDIPKEYREDFSDYIGEIDCLSVREDKGVELIKKYANRDAAHVVDPTLLFSGSEWQAMLPIKPYWSQNRKYIFCYLFGGKASYAVAIRHLQEETGCEVVTIPFSERELRPEFHPICDAGPAEFLSLIRHAECVLTDSFHASVFSIQFHKPFFVLARDADTNVNGMNLRLYSLLKSTGLNERMIPEDEYDSFDVNRSISFENVEQTLAILRQDSIAYLKKSLSEDRDGASV